MTELVQISPEIGSKLPDLQLGLLLADVKVEPTSPALETEIATGLQKLEESLKVEDISQIPAIQASRKAYKILGKDPARYRLSAEALLRRIVKGKGLYQVNNAVDLLNLVSVSTGFSIGGYDADRIEGTAVLGIGKEGEPYQAIGRGELNIAFLPLFRDKEGAFGSPTSDSVRTSVRPETQRFLMTLFNFDGGPGLEAAMEMSEDLLRRHAGTQSVTQHVLSLT